MFGRVARHGMSLWSSFLIEIKLKPCHWLCSTTHVWGSWATVWPDFRLKSSPNATTIKNPDWVVKVKWLILTNQSELFHRSIVPLCKIWFMSSHPGMVYLKNMKFTFLIRTPHWVKSVIFRTKVIPFGSVSSGRIWQSGCVAGSTFRSSAKIGDPLNPSGFLNLALSLWLIRCCLLSGLTSPKEHSMSATS